MMRKCPLSGKPCGNLPSLHVTEVSSDGEKCEMMLCHECGKQYMGEEEVTLGNIIGKMLGSMMGVPAQQREPERPKTCRCGTTFAEFHAKGRLGCGACYDTFRSEIEAILPKIGQGGEGGTDPHAGKRPTADDDEVAIIPADHPAPPSTEDEVVRLEGLMAAAVKDERYEDAAMYRDRIRGLRG